MAERELGFRGESALEARRTRRDTSGPTSSEAAERHKSFAARD
jgi:hypothetical protein